MSPAKPRTRPPRATDASISATIARALLPNARRTSSGVTDARSSRSGDDADGSDALIRMHRTLWMWAKLVATFRRLELAGKTRQTFGSTISSKSWLIRSLVRNASASDFPRSMPGEVFADATSAAMTDVSLPYRPRAAAVGGFPCFAAIRALPDDLRGFGPRSAEEFHQRTHHRICVVDIEHVAAALHGQQMRVRERRGPRPRPVRIHNQIAIPM